MVVALIGFDLPGLLDFILSSIPAAAAVETQLSPGLRSVSYSIQASSRR